MATASIYVSPTGDSGNTVTELTYSTGSAAWSLVDDYPTENQGDYIYVTEVSGGAGYVRFSFPAVTARHSTIAKVVLHCTGTLPYNSLVTFGMQFGSYHSTPAQGSGALAIETTVNPATGSAWTWNDFADNSYAGLYIANGGDSSYGTYIFMVYLEIVYTLCPQVTVDTLGAARDSDMRHVIQSAVCRLNSGGYLESLRWEIASDSEGTTLLSDSGTIATTGTDGQTLAWIHTWTPASSATYYLRVGVVCEDHAAIYWVTKSIAITVPTITASSVSQQGEYLVATMTISDPTCAKGMMFYAGGDSTPMELSGSTLRGVLWVERGDIAWSIVTLTPWATLSVQGTIYVTYKPQAGIHIYQGDAELNASGASLVENICPDATTCSFTVDADDIDITEQLVVKVHGKRWHMNIVNADDNDDGTVNVRAVDAGQTALRRTVTLAQLPTDSWSIAQRLGLRWAQDYAGLLPMLMVDAQWTDTAVSDILTQLAVLNEVTFIMHDQSVHVLGQNGEPVIAISKGRQRDCSQLTNHVREEYTVATYPSPAGLWSLTPARWTGTVVAATYTATTRLKPPSGAVAWLKATGAVSIASLSAVLADYDRFHMYWAPAASGNLTIRLEQDSSNYLEKTITYAGSVATGWLATASSSDGVATHTYNNGGTYAAITLQFDDTCLVRVREVKSGADVYVTPWMQMGTQAVNVPLNSTLVVDSLVVEVTQLHLIDVMYGVRCVAATLQAIQSVVIGSGAGTRIVWQGSANPSGAGGAVDSSTMSGGVPFPALTPDMTVTVIPSGDGSLYVTVTQPCTVAQTQLSIVPITIPESSPLQQEVDLALTDFTKTGNPVTFVKMTLTATGDNYYDAPSLKNTRGTRRSVEVFAAGWTQADDRPMIRTSDQWRNADVARAFAQSLLDKYSVPLVSYTETVDWDCPVDIGDIVATPDGDMVVNAIAWNPDAMTKTVRVGERIRNTVEWMRQVNQAVSDLQRMV